MNSNSSGLNHSFNSTATFSSSLFGDSSKNKGFWDRTLNFRTTVGRYFLLVLLLTAGFVPAVILLSQNIIMVYQAVKNLETNEAVKSYIEQSLLIKGLIHDLQLERGLSTLYISSDKDASTRDSMLNQRLNVDESYYNLVSWPDEISTVQSGVPESTTMRLELITFRHNIDTSHVDNFDVIHFFSGQINFFMSWMMDLLNSITLGNFWPDVVAFQALAFATENAGLERAEGTIFFTTGYFTPDQLAAYMKHLVYGKRTLAEAAEFSALVEQRVQSEEIRQQTEILNDFRSLIYSNGTADVAQKKQDRILTARQWVDNMTTFINALHDLQDDLGSDIKEKMLHSSNNQRTTTIYSSVLMVFEFFFYPVFVFLTVRLTNSIKQFSVKLADRLRILAREQRRNATLVKEMYPPSVAQRLLKGNKLEPENFESATVCFSGLADFGELSRISHGVDIIFFINRLFDLMDEEISKYDVFKVETVGDQYLVVSGVPLRNGDRHVAEVADMALGLLEITKPLTVDHLPNHPIRLMFGMCTGSVVTGIVGLKMPRYCLFGDTVNMASRMQSSSKALHVHMSASCVNLMGKNGNYHVSSRGEIPVKGKGMVETFWLTGRKF